MIIEYRRSQPTTARTWFAQFRIRDRQHIQNQLEQWQLMISESSVQGTEKDRELWSVATAPDLELWHRAQRHRNQSNTMLSVLAGAVSKLRSNGDLTAKQLDHVQKICDVMAYFTQAIPIKFTLVQEFTATGDRLEDLRARLFDA